MKYDAALCALYREARANWITARDAGDPLAEVRERIHHVLVRALGDPVPDCATCNRTHGLHAPSHFGSARCASGSILSGGAYAHCACEECF